ncbi:MAG: tetratricopeptide repeat protein [Cyanobacteria bacterium J06639_14]
MNHMDFLEAINLFEKGLKINEENNDLYNQAVSLEAIADTQTETNQLVKGLQTYRRATKIWETIGNQPARKRVIKEIENISKTMGFLSSTREDVNSNLETINSEDLGDDRKSV